ncbi:MAG: 4-hydroxy-tetrahydrodipicolinate reductase [Patescibacteria group bacterium]
MSKKIQKIKIALIGYGKMGKEIARLCDESSDLEVVSISYKNSINEDLDISGIKKADVAIDFTAPEQVMKNIETISKLGKNMVIGTTGWYDNTNIVKKLVSKNKIGLVYGKNFSIGANIFFKMTAFASKLFAKFSGYDVYGLEIHHIAKKDSPSGTALKIAEEIIGNFPNKKSLQVEKLDRQINSDELHFASIRGGRNPGFHEVVFESDADSVKLSHQAHNRTGFATGALVAAKFINNKKGFYSFEEIFDKLT